MMIRAQGLVPIFSHDDTETALRAMRSCYHGGGRVFEFTNRGQEGENVFRALITEARRNLPGMIVGVGSIVDAATAALFVQIGARFVVSPIMQREVITFCNRRKIAVIPGCGSVTEISDAEELGVEFCKIFPAMPVGGPDFVRSVKGPMPWVSLIPTSGVTPDPANLRTWFNAGVAAVGMGSNLFVSRNDGSLDDSRITDTVMHVLAWIADIRKT